MLTWKKPSIQRRSNDATVKIDKNRTKQFFIIDCDGAFHEKSAVGTVRLSFLKHAIHHISTPYEPCRWKQAHHGFLSSIVRIIFPLQLILFSS
jgi:hypothetical protein